jgi:hypothetical protein
VSKFGERHDRALAAVRELALPELELRAEHSDSDFDYDYDATTASVEAFIRDGEDLRAHLVAIAHGDAEVGPGDRRRIHEWQQLAFSMSRESLRDYKRFRRKRAVAGENVDLMEQIGAWALARGLDPDEAAEIQVACFSRGLAAGLAKDEVTDRMIAAMVAGEDPPF